MLRFPVLNIVRIAFAVALMASIPAGAASRAWTGAANSGSWNDPGNWQDRAVPGSADRAVFGPAAQTGLFLAQPITLEGIDYLPGGQVNALEGALTLTGAIPLTVTGGTFTLFSDVEFTALSPTLQINGTGRLSFEMQHTVTFAGGTVNLAGGPLAIFTFLANLAERSPTAISAPATTTLAGQSSLTGGVATTGGHLFILAGTVGAPSAPATISGTASLVVTGNDLVPVSIDNPLQLSAATAADNSEFGNVLMIANSEVIHFHSIALTGTQVFAGQGNPGINFDGPISGTGRMVLRTNFDERAVFTFSNPANSFTGGIEIWNGIISPAASHVLPSRGAFHSGPGTTFDLGSTSQTLESFRCEGTVRMVGGHALLEVDGLIELVNCGLDVGRPSDWPATDVVLVSNKSSAAVSGEFIGFPEGFIFNGRKITYRGGVSGRDIVLEIAPPLAVTPTAISVQAGASFSLGVQLNDSTGAPRSGVAVSFAVVAGSTGPASFPSQARTDASGHAVANGIASLQAGNYVIVVSSGSDTVQVPVTQLGNTTQPITARVQDMWWSPSENGWGMSLVEHSDVLFGALYIYDANGKPIWVVLPNGTWDSTHTTYSGPVYKPFGTPFFSYNAQGLRVGSAVGSVSINFQDANHAVLDYTLAGTSGRKLVERQVFANGAATPPDHSDLWWGGASQNGWGITVLQQASTLFSVWFTYDANSDPFWYVMPGGAWTASDTYEGHIYRTSGSPWAGATYDPAKLQVIDAGSYSIRFTGDAATFTYSVDGHSGTLPLARQPF